MNEPFRCIEAAQLEQSAQATRWIWHGYLAAGQITLFSSVPKSGKTTLLSHLLAQRREGGQLLDRPTTAGLNVVVSEEPESLWHERNARLGFAPRDGFLCRPFVGVPSPEQWLELVAYLRDLHAERGVDLAIIDPLSFFLPHGENDADLIKNVIGPLHTLTQRGVAILLVHHLRKARAAEGMMTRGSSRLPQCVDIVMEMHRVQPNDATDRRRRLLAFSRADATPKQLYFSLSTDGTRYDLIDEPEEGELQVHWPALQQILTGAQAEMTRQEIRAAWPISFPPPGRDTLWRCLNNAVAHGWIVRVGNANPNEPFRYFLPDKPAQWQAVRTEPSKTPLADAWLKRWHEQFPTPPEWANQKEPDWGAEGDR